MVPETITLLITFIPPLIFSVFPVRVVDVEALKVKVPATDRSLLSVSVGVDPLTVIFLQIIPFVANVVDRETFKVEPVVTTVPAVYVKVPVLY